MLRCGFCDKKDISGQRGLRNHWNKCGARLARITSAATQAVATEAARVESEATAAAQEILDKNIPEVPRAPSPLPPGAGGRPHRRPRLPARYCDDAPEPPTPILRPLEPEPDLPTSNATQQEIPTQTWVKTEPNAHGFYKVFPNRPTHDPEDSISLDDLCRSSQLLTGTPKVAAANPPFFSFLNSTVARLMTWFHLGSNLKSIADLDVILQDDFDRMHPEGFSAARENKRLDDASNILPGQPPSGWTVGSVKIKLPAPKICKPEADAAEFEVAGILYRPLLNVMTEAFQSPAFMQYHTTPFASRRDPNHDPSKPDTTLEDVNFKLDESGLPPLAAGHEAICGEIYTSPEMLKAHHALHRWDKPHIETIIAAYMFWSDSTHLANFGNASLWPLYTFFGNLSKYIRAKPMANAGFHQAYFPSVCLC
ncbi:hypothetical protein B0H17DRAFT_1209302 [Mycena rosella]|uniref:Uncharacterized protein n=1 Tax=Mycena rosella TaxID=1033263 RepID=A0AAD7CZ08_MYCRO|nr:hypothetical protein B0H17DRAFT_1209302 [Mycena rosella]